MRLVVCSSGTDVSDKTKHERSLESTSHVLSAFRTSRDDRTKRKVRHLIGRNFGCNCGLYRTVFTRSSGHERRCLDVKLDVSQVELKV